MLRFEGNSYGKYDFKATCLGAGNRGETFAQIKQPLTNQSPYMPSVRLLRRGFAGLAGLTLLLFGQSMQAQSGGCQSYEAAFNLEAGMRDGLTLQQAKASILEDGYSDGSATCFSAIKNEINQMPYAFPLVNQALYKRARR